MMSSRKNSKEDIVGGTLTRRLSKGFCGFSPTKEQRKPASGDHEEEQSEASDVNVGPATPTGPVRPLRMQGCFAGSTMPYCILHEDSSGLQLKGSVDGTTSNLLLSKLGLTDRVSTKSLSGGQSVTDVKMDFFDLLERSGFHLTDTNSMYNSSKSCLEREYFFRRKHGAMGTCGEDPDSPDSASSINLKFMTGASLGGRASAERKALPSGRSPVPAYSRRSLGSSTSSPASGGRRSPLSFLRRVTQARQTKCLPARTRALSFGSLGRRSHEKASQDSLGQDSAIGSAPSTTEHTQSREIYVLDEGGDYGSGSRSAID